MSSEQVEYFIMVKKVLCHEDVKDGVSSFRYIWASLKSKLGYYNVTLASSIITDCLQNKGQDRNLWRLHDFLDRYGYLEKKHNHKCSVTSFNSKNFDEFVKKVCDTRSIDFIFSENSADTVLNMRIP